MLTELGLNRSPVDYVVERLAATLGCPVVLEDSAHRVVAVAVQGEDPAQTLAPWGSGGEPALPAASARVPVAVSYTHLDVSKRQIFDWSGFGHLVVTTFERV